MEKVVITGMGTVNPLGLTVEESWRNAINGVSGVGRITHFDPSALNVHIAAEVKNFVPEQYMDAKEARRRDRFEQLAVAGWRLRKKTAGASVCWFPLRLAGLSL
jgi:3-oxoacyl-(acyl-carrier-protein) synthase